MLIEVPHAISRTRTIADSKLNRFYFRIKGRHRAKVAMLLWPERSLYPPTLDSQSKDV